MTIDLCLARFPWAWCMRHKGEAALHTLIDLCGDDSETSRECGRCTRRIGGVVPDDDVGDNREEPSQERAVRGVNGP